MSEKDYLREDERKLMSRCWAMDEKNCTATLDALQRLAEARRVLAEIQYGGDDECVACGRCLCCSDSCRIAAALEGMER